MTWTYVWMCSHDDPSRLPVETIRNGEQIPAVCSTRWQFGQRRARLNGRAIIEFQGSLNRLPHPGSQHWESVGEEAQLSNHIIRSLTEFIEMLEGTQLQTTMHEWSGYVKGCALCEESMTIWSCFFLFQKLREPRRHSKGSARKIQNSKWPPRNVLLSITLLLVVWLYWFWCLNSCLGGQGIQWNIRKLNNRPRAPVVSYPPHYKAQVRLSLKMSGGFTPCQYLRPSSGREHTVIAYSDRWYLLDEWN